MFNDLLLASNSLPTKPVQASFQHVLLLGMFYRNFVQAILACFSEAWCEPCLAMCYCKPCFSNVLQHCCAYRQSSTAARYFSELSRGVNHVDVGQNAFTTGFDRWTAKLFPMVFQPHSAVGHMCYLFN